MLRLAQQVPTLARQRSHVSMSIDKPRNRSSGGEDQCARHHCDGENSNRIPKPSRHARDSLQLAPRLQAGQAADERRLARLGVGIDF